MKQFDKFYFLWGWLAIFICLCEIEPALAETKILANFAPRNRQLENRQTKIHSISTQTLLSQNSTPASLVQVTAIELKQTENGIEIILETPAGEQLQVLPRIDGNTYIADIPNTQLNLQGGNTFRQDNPTEGITAVTVTNGNANSIRVTVTGSSGVPTAELFDSDEGLIFSLTPVGNNTRSEQPPQKPLITPQPGSETQQETTQPSDETPLAPEAVSPGSEAQRGETSTQEDDPIEIVVTGDRETGYSVPNATSATRTDTPLRDIPQSIQVVPRQVLEEQQVTRIGDAARNVSGVTPKPGYAGATDNYTIRGFEAPNNLRNGFRDDGFYSFTDRSCQHRTGRSSQRPSFGTLWSN